MNNYKIVDNSKLEYWANHKSEAIYDYIAENSGTTENQTVDYLTKLKICSRVTIRRILYEELIPDGKIIDKKVGNSFHRFYINDKSQYQKLITRIDNLSKEVAEVQGIVDDPNFKNVTIPNLKSNTPEAKINYSEIMHFCQVTIHVEVYAIIHKIMKLPNDNDRLPLFLRLGEELYKSKGIDILFDAGIVDKLSKKMSQISDTKSKEYKTIKRLWDVLWNVMTAKI